MKFIKIDYLGNDDVETFEIFRSVDKAFKFTENKVVIKRFLSVSLSDMNNAYYDKDLKCWNYEDINV